VNALRDSLLWTASSLAAIGKEQDVITLEGRKRTVGEILDEANEALNVPDDAAPTSHPIPTGATGEDGRSATYGMTLGERIAHVGGRTNAQGYTEFGSPMAVNALIQHVLRDLDWTRQDDDGAYQARYRLPDGEWSSWGHVVCGVKGHEQELRYLPGERRPAPAAGDALDRDQQRLALWQAIRDITIGNLHDDKLILANLHKAGYVIALAAIAQQKGEA
ncbi:hypothetical protein, partial [Achromobacter piechaudii]